MKAHLKVGLYVAIIKADLKVGLYVIEPDEPNEPKSGRQPRSIFQNSSPQQHRPVAAAARPADDRQRVTDDELLDLEPGPSHRVDRTHLDEPLDRRAIVLLHV